MYCTVMTLQEHLGHTGCESEVAVDLEWGMSVEEIRIGASIGIFLGHGVTRQQREHIADNLEGMVAVEHTRPEIYFPSYAPSSGHIATLDERVACSLEQLGIERR